jgi:hypothetical protein
VGVGKMAYLADNTGAVTRCLVCPGCYATAIPVVVSPPTTVAPRCATPGCKELAAFCAHCMGRTLEHNRELSTANVVRHMAGQHEAGEEVE